MDRYIVKVKEYPAMERIFDFYLPNSQRDNNLELAQKYIESLQKHKVTTELIAY